MKKIFSIILSLALLQLSAIAQGKESGVYFSRDISSGTVVQLHEKVGEPLTAASANESSQKEAAMKISIQIQSDSGSHALTATLSDSSSAKAFYELLQKGSLTVRLSDYGGFEKVGSLGRSLARNDRQTATKPGDIMLYQGNQITIFYGNNSWSYSSLGKIDGATQSGLKKVLGRDDVTATFSIQE